MKYAFIHQERQTYPLTVLCQVLQVSRSGYDAFLKKPPTGADPAVLAQVRRLHVASVRPMGNGACVGRYAPKASALGGGAPAP
jgi:hypothetical protein